MIETVALIAYHLTGKDGTEKDLEFYIVLITQVFHPLEGGDALAGDFGFIFCPVYQCLIKSIHFLFHEEIEVFLCPLFFIEIIVIFSEVSLSGLQAGIPLRIIGDLLEGKF